VIAEGLRQFSAEGGKREWIADLGRQSTWGIEQGARSQNPEFRRKRA